MLAVFAFPLLIFRSESGCFCQRKHVSMPPSYVAPLQALQSSVRQHATYINKETSIVTHGRSWNFVYILFTHFVYWEDIF